MLDAFIEVTMMIRLLMEIFMCIATAKKNGSRIVILKFGLKRFKVFLAQILTQTYLSKNPNHFKKSWNFTSAISLFLGLVGIAGSKNGQSLWLEELLHLSSAIWKM